MTKEFEKLVIDNALEFSTTNNGSNTNMCCFRAFKSGATFGYNRAINEAVNLISAMIGQKNIDCKSPFTISVNTLYKELQQLMKGGV
jgi:hypothetical protein